MRQPSDVMRRRFLGVGLASPLILFFPVAGRASRLDPGSATAEALEYTHDASDVSAEQRGGADRTCANCRFFQGGDSEWSTCEVFPENQVNRNGWCRSWVARENG